MSFSFSSLRLRISSRPRPLSQLLVVAGIPRLVDIWLQSWPLPRMTFIPLSLCVLFHLLKGHHQSLELGVTFSQYNIILIFILAPPRKTLFPRKVTLCAL